MLNFFNQNPEDKKFISSGFWLYKLLLNCTKVNRAKKEKLKKINIFSFRISKIKYEIANKERRVENPESRHGWKIAKEPKRRKACKNQDINVENKAITIVLLRRGICFLLDAYTPKILTNKNSNGNIE